MRALACSALLPLIAAAQVLAQAAPSPGPATTLPQVSAAQFLGLRWLEGTWRGRMPNGRYVHDRYAFIDDSTIRIVHYADSTMSRAGQDEWITLRAGVVRHGRSAAIRFDTSSIDFATAPRVTPQFTFARAAGGAWTTTLHGAGARGSPIVYRMERFSRAASLGVDDRSAVRDAVLDYVEGFYEGDTARLVRSVWPQVRKYGYARNAALGTYRGMAMAFPDGFMSVAGAVRSGRTPTPADAPKEIIIYDVQDQTASAKLVAWWGTDYLLLAKENGRWMITHVLWQTPRPGTAR